MQNPWILHLVPIAALLFAANARAEEPGAARKVQLDYVRPDGEVCPDEERLRHAIRVETEDNPFSGDAKALLRVTIARVGNRFQSRYELRDDKGKLVKEEVMPVHATCVLAMESAAWSVGIFMPTLLTAPVRSAEPPPPEKPAPSSGCRLDAALLVSLGTAPTTAFGFSAHGGWRWSIFSLSGGVRFEFSPTLGKEGASISTSRALGEVVPCLHGYLPWDIVVLGCGVAQAGVLIPSVQTPEFTVTGYAPSAAGGARLGVQVPLAQPFPRGFSLLGFGDLTGMVWHTNIFPGGVPPSGGGAHWMGSPFTGAFGLGVALTR